MIVLSLFSLTQELGIFRGGEELEILKAGILATHTDISLAIGTTTGNFSYLFSLFAFCKLLKLTSVGFLAAKVSWLLLFLLRIKSTLSCCLLPLPAP